MNAVGVLLLVALAQAKNFGSLQIKGDTAPSEVYVVGPDWAADFVEMLPNGFRLNGGGRVYLASKPVDDFSDPSMWWQTPLLGTHFAYKLDLSNVGCKCNAAGYFIDMPGPAPGDGGDWYCDANFVNNQWCPEYDTLESNKYVIAGTLHTCDGSPGAWNNCDRGGCQVNAFNVDSNMLCPESRCTINTMNPFIISHNQDFGYANIWMGQDGKEASFNVCNDGGYSNRMAESYADGMVFGASLWGGDGINMDWLDGMTGCSGPCNLPSSSVTFTDFEIWKEAPPAYKNATL